ncbi:fimbrial protein [Providencia heimbachae]|uniref:Fimbrial protein n=1 Tax=Providencia heimbachae ATCC 35613 TaxID=1354272 RepID=A0A1B7JRH0_9GAMM|nr:fimbrial protein [Providencia heimbachae]OAT50490.1 hypothetical protein M998_2652 [Providencia heimbachae ATCC 35613]SQH11878.1 Uncharacterised protein [Providencia heimbachae]
MSKQQVIDKTGCLWAVLLIVGSVFSHTVMAASPVANTPVNQSDHETIHQGIVLVRAAIFIAPCNLHLKEKLILTGCGAGNDYREMNLSDGIANTPVTLQFYNTQDGKAVVGYPLSLLNGNNEVHIPALMKSRSSLRLEVDYE